MDFSEILIRSSSLGHIMVDPKDKASKERGDLSESAKTHLVDIYVVTKYGRKTDITNKYMEKGLAVEENSITLYSRVKGKFFRKNEKHFTNAYIMGTPDITENLNDEVESHVFDTKSSWDIFTFFRNKAMGINRIYYWQLMGYMALTGAKKATLIYCLVDTPELMILDEERRLMYKLNAGTTENPDYMEACEELRKLSIYNDIPMNERIIEITIDRNEAEIQRIYDRVKKCREFLNELEKSTNNNELKRA